MTANDIKKMALDCGACELINGADSIADLVALMKTPHECSNASVFIR